MKFIFFLTSLWALISCAHPVPENQALDATNAGFRLDRGFLFFHNKPFTGQVVEKYPGGNLKSRTSYQTGKRFGTAETWYPTGGKDAVRYYKNGEKEGTHEAWWPNGQLRFRYFFRNGETEGDQWEWYSNSAPATHFQYRKGHEAGPQVAWRENGKPYINLVITNGRHYGLFNSKLCFTVKDGEAKMRGTE
ncbi:MAG: toxin-antitoxin system YwqK family antitoxin [Spirochaetia bacterium]|nr:toxin-antitoxin system YwqK family antitoxin [Spirochaetia bacterium]